MHKLEIIVRDYSSYHLYQVTFFNRAEFRLIAKILEFKVGPINGTVTIKGLMGVIVF